MYWRWSRLTIGGVTMYFLDIWEVWEQSRSAADDGSSDN
jgi:hypothetical protein